MMIVDLIAAVIYYSVMMVLGAVLFSLNYLFVQAVGLAVVVYAVLGIVWNIHFYIHGPYENRDD